MRARRNGPTVLLLLIALLLAGRTRQQAAVWRSEPALWTQAVRQAPFKPRPWINLGAAYVGAGRIADAKRAFLQAQRVAALPHVPFWDRATAVLLTTPNLRTVDALLAGGAR